jgi:phosphate:Na+ symporter
MAEQLAKLLRAEQHLLACAGQSLAIAHAQAEIETVNDTELLGKLSEFHLAVVKLMEMANPDSETFSFVNCETQLAEMQSRYDDVKELLLHAGVESRTSIPGAINLLDQNSRIRRMARQMVKAMYFLGELYVAANVKIAQAADQPEEEKVNH